MKKILILGLVFCVSFASCRKKDEYKIEDTTYGTTATEINGTSWNQDIKLVELGDSDKFSFYAFKYKDVDGTPIVFEVLSFNQIDKIKNKQQNVKSWNLGQSGNNYLNARFTTTQDDGDLSCDRFEILETDSTNNWIQITKEEDDYNEVWGNYSATFVRKYGCPSSPYTDTLRFRNGSFHFKFK